MAGFSAGSAYISISPNLKGFGADVKAQLRGEDLSANVKLNPDLDEKEGQAKADVAAERMSGKNVHFNAELDTAGAEAKAVAFGAVLGGIGTSGAASVARITAGFVAMPAVVGLAGGAIAALPGLIGLMGAPIATVALGMDGIKKAAQSITPQFNALKAQVSAAFSTGLTPVMRQVATIFPTIGAGAVQVAGALSNIAGQVVRVVSSTAGLNAIRTIFGTVATILNGLAPVFAQLTGVFLQFVSGSLSGLTSLVPAIGGFASGLGTVINQLGAGGLGRASSLFGQLLGAVLSIIPPIISMGVNLWNAVGPSVIVLVQGIVSAMGPLGQILMALAPAFNYLATTIAGILTPALNFLVPIFQFLSPVLGPIAVVVLGIVGALYALTTVISIVTAVMAVFEAVTSPVGIVILIVVAAIAALIAIGYLIVTNWSSIAGFFVGIWNTISAAFQTAWAFISSIVSTAWNSVIYPVLSAIGTVLAYIGAIIFTVLVAPFVIAWNIISAIVSGVVNGVLIPLWNGVVAPALQFLGSVFTWLWTNAVVPAWNGISAAVSAAWGFVSGIFNAIVSSVSGFLGPIFTWLWNSVIVPVWNGISAAISASWSFISGIFNAIVGFLQGVLGPIFTWLWHSVIEPVWGGIQSVIQGAWNVIQGVFNVGMAAVHAVGQAFSDVATWIGQTWSTIENAARAPVQFVVDVVYNNGIRPVWNGIASLFGMPQLGPVNLATGGVLPGFAPGVDSIPAMLSAGEGVLVPEAVQGLGPSFVGWANSFYSGGRSSGGIGTPGNGGFSRGGIAHFADGGILGGIGGLLSGAGDFLMQMFTDPVGAVKGLFSGVISSGANTPGAGSWTGALKGIPGKVVDAVVQKVKDFIATIGSLGGGGGAGVQQWAGVAAQALALAGAPASWLPLLLAQMQTESGGNPGIANLTDINAQEGHPSIGLMQVIPSTFAAYAGPLAGLGITNPLANIYAAIKYTMARYGSPVGVWGQGHGYDSGGWLPTGPSLTYNNTGRPEPILTTNQWADISAAAQNNGTGGPQTVIYVTTTEGQSELGVAAAVQRRLDFEGRLQT